MILEAKQIPSANSTYCFIHFVYIFRKNIFCNLAKYSLQIMDHHFVLMFLSCYVLKYEILNQPLLTKQRRTFVGTWLLFSWQVVSIQSKNFGIKSKVWGDDLTRRGTEVRYVYVHMHISMLFGTALSLVSYKVFINLHWAHSLQEKEDAL